MAKPRSFRVADASAGNAAPAARPSRRLPRAAGLGPGLHAGTIELRSGRSFQVRTAAGALVTATLDDEVDPALAEDCLCSGRRVVLADGESGPVILGALQTSAPVVKDPDGCVTIQGRELRLRADKQVVIDAGPVSLRLHESGAVRVEGEKMVIDMPALLRILSASVELP